MAEIFNGVLSMSTWDMIKLNPTNIAKNFHPNDQYIYLSKNEIKVSVKGCACWFLHALLQIAVLFYFIIITYSHSHACML